MLNIDRLNELFYYNGRDLVRKYLATIRYNKKLINLGYFDDPEVADQIVRTARVKLHGEFANNG